MRDLPTGTVTFLFSDIEGSTRLLDELGPKRYADVLAEHRRVMREAFAAHGGVEVDTQGDAFFVAFPSASAALQAAGEAQQALAKGPVQVRVGLHSGKPLVTAEGYVGMDVHQGARVMSAGHGGQVLVSEATYAELDDAAELSDLGLHRLKDLTDPQRLWQLGDGEFPPLKTLYQTNLPVQPTPLVGRERELAELLELLRRERLVTLTGAGGSGKTRLALQAAAELTDEFKDGVWWISLAPLRDPALVEPTIAQVVGARDDLAEHLRQKQTLLLLDNFEQVVEAGSVVAKLLSEAPKLRILVTSRERLAIAAEHEYLVPTLQEAEAVALFTARARQLKPAFEPDDEVAEICRRLDGLPLAVELAAARVKLLRPDQILERLGRSLDLLTAGRRDAPERQRTLRATIEWSYELLPEEEKHLFARLAVFAGSLSEEAAEAVCEADLDALAALVDKSLLRQTDEGRFFMLETIREYAAERLSEAGDDVGLVLRHAQFFSDLVERLDPQLRGREQERALSAFEHEHDNVRAAIDAAAARALASLEAQLAGASWYFWYVRGHVLEGVARLEHALAADGIDEPSRARLHEGLTVLESVRGNHKRARWHADVSLPLRRRLGDPNGILRSLANRAALAGHEGDLELADALHAECAELARDAGNPWFRGLALSNVAWVAVENEDYERAVAVGGEAMNVLREVGDVQSEAACALNLAQAELGLGRSAAGMARLTEFLEQQRALKLPEQTLWGLEVVATNLVEEAPERSARLLGATAAIATELGYVLSAKYQRRRREALASLQERLEPEAVEAALADGRELSLDEAVGYALDSIAERAEAEGPPRD
jgi:predicted ATPase/class 3 adenylate cyclase